MKIRIKALIDINGKYCAYGYSDCKSSEVDDTLYEVVHGMPSKEYWITVDLPLPEAEEVEAQRRKCLDMDDGFAKTYDALRHGKFLWRPRRKTETAAEYVGKRDKAIAGLYGEINHPYQPNKSGVEK